MNIFDKIRISRNPNIIDTMGILKLNKELVNYALQKGYKFNPETISKFVRFKNYVKEFSQQPEVLQHFISEAINSHSLDEIRDTLCNYDNEQFRKIILENTELHSLVIDKLDELFSYGSIKNGDILEICQGNDDLLYSILQSHKNLLEEPIIIKYLIEKKELSELYEKGYLKSNNIESVINLNIETFYPYLDKLENEYSLITGESLITQNTQEKVIQYLIDNNVPYQSETIPLFAKQNQRYQLSAIMQNPKIVEQMENDGIDVKKIDDKQALTQIAEKIKEQQIVFDKIPSVFNYTKETFEAIVENNPKIFDNIENLRDNLRGINSIVYNMTNQQVVEYYRKMGIPFNSISIDKFGFDNIDLILECLKNDSQTLSDINDVYSKEDYIKIAEVAKNIPIEDILKNEFLIRNPYVVSQLLKSGVDLSEIDFSKTHYYREFYNDLALDAKKNGIKLPKPEKLQYEITPEGIEITKFDSIEDLNSLVEMVQNKGVDTQIIINLEQEGAGENNGRLIPDNLDLFEQYSKLIKNNNKEKIKGLTGISFKYNSNSYDNNKKNNLFSLEQIIESEHFIKSIADEINSKGFSPLEKTVAIYDIVKNFKPASEEKENEGTAVSRGIYEIMSGDAMVCVGYANLLERLGDEVGLDISEISISFSPYGLHSRNYINLVDEKYGINGYYVLEPTWEASGHIESNEDNEAHRNTYKDFLLTTDEGRKEVPELGAKVKTYGYDSILIAEDKKTTERLLEMGYIDLKFIQKIDGNFWSMIKGIGAMSDEYYKIIQNYKNKKINNSIPKEKIIEAIIQVKRTIYKNYTEQDFEDMKMNYSITLSDKYDENDNKISIFGDEYYEYLHRTYDECKNMTAEEIIQKRPQCDLDNLIIELKSKELADDMLFNNLKVDKFYVSNKIVHNEYIEILKNNKELIAEMGFEFKEKESDLDDSMIYYLYFPEDDKKLTLEERIEFLKAKRDELYKGLGLVKEEVTISDLKEINESISANERKEEARKISEMISREQELKKQNGIEI